MSKAITALVVLCVVSIFAVSVYGIVSVNRNHQKCIDVCLPRVMIRCLSESNLVVCSTGEQIIEIK